MAEGKPPRLERSEWNRGLYINNHRARSYHNNNILFHIQLGREGLEAKAYGKERRSHWGIENSLHWVLDIGFREDESRMRAGNAAENVNVLRHIGINLLKQEKSCRMGIASKRKKCGYDSEYLYKVLRGLNIGIE